MLKNLEHTSLLVIGGGGREAALVHGYSKSPAIDNIFAAPGNDLMADLTEKPVTIFSTIATTNIPAILEVCHKYQIGFVDIAQDNAVQAGLGDALQREGILFTGPTRATGQIEWDKAWARHFMQDFHIPHPAFQTCSSIKDGYTFLDSQPDQPWVIKANGLAEGKGVILTPNKAEAKKAIRYLKNSALATAAETYLIEQCLVGEEFSTYAVSDGKDWQLIGSAQDHKRAFDGDQGQNTGGMGSSTPPLLLTPELMPQVSAILDQTFEGMKKIGRPYTGVLYLGGMVVQENGVPKVYVIEYNARWGDPEAQVIVPGLETDLFEMGLAVATQQIQHVRIQVDGKARVGVAATGKGYPDRQAVEQVKGKEIIGLNEAKKKEGVMIFGAGIQLKNGKYIVNGGRVLYVIGEGKDVIEAREKAYGAMSEISIEGNNLHYRTDIGSRDVARLETPNK